MHPDFHAAVLSSQPICPGVKIVRFTKTPCGMATAAFSVAPLVDEEDIIPHIPIHIHIRDAHGAILIKPVKKDNRTVRGTAVFDVGSTKFRPVSGTDFHGLPPVLLLPAVNARKICCLFRHAEDFFPRRGEHRFISGISRIESCSDKGKQKKKNQYFYCFKEKTQSNLLISVYFIFEIDIYDNARRKERNSGRPENGRITAYHGKCSAAYRARHVAHENDA